MIYNLGSINTDHIYRLSHLPRPGETLAADSYVRILGGKGANQSVAVARAGASVRHIGAVGPDGDWLVAALAGHGVDVTHVARSAAPSGHAVIHVDAAGENAIVIWPGANRALHPADVAAALDGATPGDWLLMQNETSLQVETAQLARDRGMRIACSAAPFEPDAVRAVLPYVTLLILNAVEADQLRPSLGRIDVPQLLVTHGAQGAEWHDLIRSEHVTVPAFSVNAVDTTGAGDCFAGYAVAGLSQGMNPQAALTRAAAAAALQVTRPGAAEAIPGLSEVLAFLPQE